MEDFNSKYTGQQVEDLLDQVASGNAGGGGGGITVETDPIFSASPAATITEDDKATWSGKQDTISDLATIRSGAEKGATALQSIPEGYVTEDQLMWIKAEGEAGIRLKGTNGTATGNFAISAGDDKTASDGTPFASVASGDHAVAFGYGNTCAGRTTLAQGLYNIVNNKDSVAFGQRNIVNGDQSFAVGQQNEVSARMGVAIGYKNKATNTNSTAIGYQNTSSGSGSVALGDTCESGGTSSTAMGYKTKATGDYSSAFGQNTQATNSGEVAMGSYNKSTTSTDASEQTAFSFGIGTSDTNRLNALEIKKNGDVYIGDKLLSSEGGTTEVYIADFTITSLREGMINGSYVNCDMQALVAAMNANKIILVRDDADSSYKGVYVLNGYAEDLLYFSIVDTAGNVLYCDGTDYVYTKSYINGQTLFYRSWDDKQDKLQSGTNIKTINGESILGSGNITIAGGSGEKGEKGDKGDTGVGVQSVKQTTTSNVDSGYNVVTVTLTDGTTSTFSVKNGSKGSTGANGTNGVSVSSVKQTTISSADGGTNVVTVTLSNGTTSTFNVKNGSKGSSGSNGTNGKDGADGEDGATFTPSVDSAGNLSWSNNKGLANPPTVNIKGPKGDAGEGGGSSGGGKEIVLSSSLYFDDASPVQPNKIYISNIAQTAMYIGAFQEASNYDEYCIIFKYPEEGVTLPESVKFANGQIPTIEYATECELSVVGIGSGANRTYHAVLTPFKPV